MSPDDAEKVPLAKRFFIPTANPKPSSFNPIALSVRVVAKTEEPFLRRTVYFPQPVPVVTPVAGAMIPDIGQVPLLDSHNDSTVAAILGSARNFGIAGTAVECDVFFSRTAEGLNAAQKVREGHLTDFSVGLVYFLSDAYPILPGEIVTISGNIIRGPAVIVTRWLIKELSIVAIGADPFAKVRQTETPAEPETQVANPNEGQPQEGFKISPRLIIGLILVSYWILVLFKGILS